MWFELRLCPGNRFSFDFKPPKNAERLIVFQFSYIYTCVCVFVHVHTFVIQDLGACHSKNARMSEVNE